MSENVTDESLAKLEKTMRAKKKAAPLRVLTSDGTASWDRQLIDPAIIELALSLRLPVEIPKGDPSTYTFWLWAWAQRSGNPLDDLVRVGKHPYFGKVLVASFMPTRETKNEVGNWLERAVRCKGFDGVLAALDAFGATLADTWTLGALEVHEPWIEGLCQPAVLERCPALARAIRELDPARLLRNQLRAGIMDEWCWPQFEEALALIPKERQREAAEINTGPHPYGVLLDATSARIVAYGPEGIVLDKKVPKKKRDVRGLYFSNGDVLVNEYAPQQAWWVSDKKPFQTDFNGFFEIACDGALITRSDQLFAAGARTYKSRKQGNVGGRRAWFDGKVYCDVAQETVLGSNGKPIDGRPDDYYTFDPKTAERTGNALPEWMAGLVGKNETLIVHIQVSFICPVAKGAEQSPLGAKNGFGGHALYTRNGEVIAEGIDGRRAPGLVNGKYVAALMTFPERKGFYPVIENVFDLGVAMPDGTTPLIPADGLPHAYWAGSPARHLLEWHALRPRDLAGSRALAKCSDAAAKAMFDAATKPAPPTEAILAAIRGALPDVEHPRLIDGIAGIVSVAAEAATIVARLKSRSIPRAAAAQESTLHNEEVAALAQLLDHSTPWWVEKLGIQFGQQILDVSTYLFHDTSDAVSTPARTVFPWDRLVTRVGEVLYRVLALGTPKPKRLELIKALELWKSSAFPSNMKRIRLVELAMNIDGLDREHPDRLIAATNRYFLRHAGDVVRGIESTADGTFRVPPGAKLKSATPADHRFDMAAVEKTLALFAERGPVPFDEEVSKVIAKKTKLSVAAASLVWTAGYDPWLTGEKKRERFGIDRDALDRAEVELKKKRLRELYVKAMPDNPEDMFDGRVVAQRIIEAW